MNEGSRKEVEAPDLGGRIKEIKEQINLLQENFDQEVESHVSGVKAEIREVRGRIESQESRDKGPEARPERYTDAEISRLGKKEKARLRGETDIYLEAIREEAATETRAKLQRLSAHLESESRGGVRTILGVFKDKVSRLHTDITEQIPEGSPRKKVSRYELTLAEFYMNYEYIERSFK